MTFSNLPRCAMFLLKFFVRPIYRFYCDYSKKRAHAKYVFADPSRPIQNKRVNVIYWRRSDGQDNVGDLVSLELIRELLKRQNIKIEQDVKKTQRLLGIGSILHEVYHPSVIWGSGLHHTGCRIPKATLDIRAVRGPLTYQRLISAGYSCPAVFGDPGILAPEVLGVTRTKNDGGVLIIPHFSKEVKYKAYGKNVISTLTSDWKAFLERIASSTLVISGSLHGLIFAEALGVPAILLEDADFDLFKYNDYYYSTGRRMFPVAKSVEDAYKLSPSPIPDLDSIKSNILASFPIDLWSESL